MDHVESRTKVCLLCFRKGTFVIENGKFLNLIQEHIIPGLDIIDFRKPKGICGSCKTAVYNRNKGRKQNFPRLHILHDFIEYQRWISPRCPSCTCLVCQVATANGKEAKKIQSQIKRGRPKERLGLGLGLG